ncbi:MAG: hypothetical protein UR46_C0032G0004 [Parcubacteria group bacterium GW2011_GWA1_33_6]|uniref:Uncharacterized protein n=1 Tax=Candidatus Staskawiczbacteria bacterium RIFCSPHIGHO2_02_FULL_33_16 TaxID=1802204 RepID=A0A1G2HTJ9_9BACT|nr:MAG: hypothetical protein UR31_C0016G0012 [Parcubacteria group bacterium GW2011_GWA2_33_14]KKP53785.1 MAG: hypothetical protein UR46_C0032G0004 [Parcubacteria group bacterium GW2011_GWA1_33_6]OGZ65729.1 MAG: hypothetical protein A3D34_03495 [Candidatus Staskawiczbacteria bacterium RIFCSPHIGHO2_02_FULL_33_16]OGZ70008.1 MAG: hypothetical protein A2980_00015 [Candidatus Staskawiczbacteria bacterium RIFCSPLOWO2_01_FULL_33_13]
MAKIKKNIITNSPDEPDSIYLEQFGKEINSPETPSDSTQEKDIEKELTSEDIVHRQIREEIENIDLDDSLKLQIQSQSNKIQPLKEEKKLKKLLEIAKKKGVVFAINIAKKMANPYILDTFHDILVKEGYYKKFLK